MPASIRRLNLHNFRNYHAASLEADAPTIVLVGPNGAGKTNLIEAISFLAPGRGLRRATLNEVACSEADGSWAVAAEIEGALGLATLGTGIERPADADAAIQRRCRIDREPAPSPSAFADQLRPAWPSAKTHRPREWQPQATAGSRRSSRKVARAKLRSFTGRCCATIAAAVQRPAPRSRERV